MLSVTCKPYTLSVVLLSVVETLWLAPSFESKITLVWKCLTSDNTLAYFYTAKITTESMKNKRRVAPPW
jgi:hypothetical protein